MGEQACGPVIGHLHPLLEPQPSDDGIEYQHLRARTTLERTRAPLAECGQRGTRTEEKIELDSESGM